MEKSIYRFSNASVDYYFAGGISHLKDLADPKNTVLITDEHVFDNHRKRFRNWDSIVLKPGEDWKVQATVDAVIGQLIDMEAHRKTTLVGVGGGVITDLTGYIASIYMRGLRFGFIPTSLLALVDASIGGKNGIDVGVYKNLVGTIRQPSFILHDMVFLNSLPEMEWRNGFAEIIKHASILDRRMFGELESGSLRFYRNRKISISRLVQRNAILKTRLVQGDEFEQGNRKWLNFGHTLGHALENQYELSHGQAISIGMTFAAHLSGALAGFRDTERVVSLLSKYDLPTYADFDKKKVFGVMRMDKKKSREAIDFVLLERIGKAVTKKIDFSELEKFIGNW